MLVIRKKENHLEIKSFGYVESGGLGEFDLDVYEEVELNELPEGWIQSAEKLQAQGKDLVQYIESAFQGQSLLLRGTLLNLFVNFPLHADLASATGSPYLNIKDLLLSATCNPLSQSDLDEVINIISTGQVSEETRNQFISLANTWAVDKRLG